MTPAEHVARSKKWIYFGRNNSFPTLNTIACGCPKRSGRTGHFADAALVFEAAALDLTFLREIFTGESADFAMDKGTFSSYHLLGSCSAENDEGWKMLAKATNKKIVFVLCHGQPQGIIRAIYYPGGRVIKQHDK